MKTEKKDIIVGAIIIIAIICIVVSCNNDNPQTDNVTTPISKETNIESNTNEMVTHLVKKGREKAKNATESDLAEALQYIEKNIDNCFNNNETMENFIYYGSLLEYYYDEEKVGSDIRGEIGMDAVQLVKYVYREVEFPTDDATLSNLKQVKEGLAKIN